MDRIDDYPRLCASLGKARTDRIRDHQTLKHAVGGARTRWVANPFQEVLAEHECYTVQPVFDDIFSGVARTDQAGDKSLSAGRLFVLLACNKRVSTDLIQAVMSLDSRQARRYMAAAKLIIYLMGRKLIAAAQLRRSPTLQELRNARYSIQGA